MLYSPVLGLGLIEAEALRELAASIRSYSPVLGLGLIEAVSSMPPP